MDQYGLGILKGGDSPAPVIKIFYALGAKTPCLKVVRHAPTDGYKAVVYGIWCSGLPHEIFGPIEEAKESVWRRILQAACGWHAIYRADTSLEEQLNRSMNPAAASEEGHWAGWCEDESDGEGDSKGQHIEESRETTNWMAENTAENLMVIDT